MVLNVDLTTVAYMAFNFFSSIGIIFANKAMFSVCEWPLAHSAFVLSFKFAHSAFVLTSL